ncbi:MAG: hypothetical protein HKN82_13510 [Akkermansiaceae bacterium]|nr:hypothetical protein [Akkermansiaceae bacterium]NNM29333.1 hypothetical protein [Akkermansiaceae bacterium]
MRGHRGPVRETLLRCTVLVLGAPCAAAVEFEKDVLPILESNCLECHCDKKEKGDLNLEPHRIAKHIGSGEVIQPGKSTESLMIRVMQTDDPDSRMPPKGSRVSDKDIAVLKLWIARGAEVPKVAEPLEGTWTNQEGVEIEAALLRVDGEMAVLKLKSGKTTRYPIAKLSEESQAKVREWAEQAE